MPYFHAGEKWFRVSEPLASLECQNTGFQVVYGDPRRARLANGVTLPGTYTHYNIAKFMAAQQGLEPPPVPRLNDGTAKIIATWRKQGIISEVLYEPARSGLNNFKLFWSTYDITPVEIERTIFWTSIVDGKPFRIGGTVDLIARIKLNGTTNIIEWNGKNVSFFSECCHQQPDPLCQCTEQSVVTMVDWKYSRKRQKSHPMQLAAYWLGAEKTSLLDRIAHNGKYPFNFHNWSVLLRTPKLKGSDDYLIDFQRFKYPFNQIGDFFAGCRILQDPKPITRSYYSGNMSVKMFCSFCAEKLNCPLNGFWVPMSGKNIQISEDIATVF